MAVRGKSTRLFSFSDELFGKRPRTGLPTSQQKELGADCTEMKGEVMHKQYQDTTKPKPLLWCGLS